MWIHFISIGGSVMHQLAIALKNKGYKITGSDDEIFEPAAGNLKKAEIFPEKMGWHVENIKSGIDAVILGMHAKQDNPELKIATESGLTIYSFPEYIYKESIDKKRVA
ncbi:MAG: Mur ligase domain-containing protein, partial [Ginsengibacter sp.]